MQNTIDFRYVNYSLMQAGKVFNPTKITADIASSQSIKLPKAINMEFSAQYTSPALSGVYVLKSFFYADAGFKKVFANKKLDARLSVTDLFNTIRYRGYSVYEGANVSYNHRGDNRRVNISFTYHLGGKLNAGKERRLEEEDRVQ